MTITIRAVTAKVTNTATQDFTVPGMGAAGDFVGAIFIQTLVADPEVEGAKKHGVMGVGFTDGTNDRACGESSQDNAATSLEKRLFRTDACTLSLRSTGILSHRGSFDSWITDGVRVRWDVTVGNRDFMCTVILFADDAATKVLKMQCGHFTSLFSGLTTITTTGMTPKIILGISTHSDPVAVTSHSAFNFGIAVDTGSGLAQHGFRNGAAFGSGFATVYAEHSSDWTWANIYKSLILEETAVVEMNAGNFKTDMIQGTADKPNHVYLAIEPGALNYALIEKLSPLNGALGAYPITSAGAGIPQLLLGVTHELSAKDVRIEDSRAGSHFLAVATPGFNGGHGWSNQDGPTTTQTTSYWTQNEIVSFSHSMPDTGLADRMRSDGTTFIQDGAELNVTQANFSGGGGDLEWPWLIIETDASAPSPMLATVTGAATLPTADLSGRGFLGATASGSGTITASIRADAAISATIVGAGTVIAPSIGKGFLVSTVSCVGTVPTASLKATGRLQATASGSATVTAGISGRGLLGGTVSCVGTVSSAILTGRGIIAATVVGAGTVTAPLTSTGALVATISGVGTIPTASLLNVTLGAMAATVSGVGTVPTADLAGRGFLVATSSGVSSLPTPDLAGRGFLVSTLAGVGTVASADLAGRGLLTATVAGLGTVPTASLTDATLGFAAIAATISGTASMPTADLAGRGFMAGSLTGSAALTATLGSKGVLAATVTASGSVAATLAGRGLLVSTLAGSGTVAATLAGRGLLGVTISGLGTVTATVRADAKLAATILGVSTVTAPLVSSGIGFWAKIAIDCMQRFETQVATPLSIPTLYANAFLDPDPPDGLWAILGCEADRSAITTFGGRVVRKAWGRVTAEFRIPIEEGEQGTAAAIDATVTAFRKTITTVAHYLTPSASKLGLVDGRWYAWLVECPYVAEETVLPSRVSGGAFLDQEAAFSVIRERFRTKVEDVKAVTTQYDNDFLDPKPEEWIRHSIIPGESEQLIRGTTTGRFRSTGVTISEVFVPHQTGTKRAMELADAIDDAYVATSDSGVTFDTPTVSRGGVDDRWWRVAVTCPYTFEQT